MIKTNPLKIYEYIKAFFVAKDGVNKIKGAYVKNGILTTEFWLTVITVAGTVFSAIHGFIPADLMVKISVIASGIYTIARAIVKMTGNSSEQAILDKIDQTFGTSTTAPANTTVVVK